MAGLKGLGFGVLGGLTSIGNLSDNFDHLLWLKKIILYFNSNLVIILILYTFSK